MTKRIRNIGIAICATGAIGCLLVGLTGIVMISYWHHVTGSWLDDHIFFWQSIGMPSVISVFFFTRILLPLFER